MCYPQVIVAAVGLVTSAIGAQQERHRAAEDNRIATEEAVDNQRLLNRRIEEERLQAARDIAGVQRDAQQALGSARAEAAAGSTGGANVDALLADFVRRESEFRGAVGANLTFATQQIEAQKRGVARQLRSRRLSNRFAVAQSRARLLGSALDVASSGIDAHTEARQRRTG